EISLAAKKVMRLYRDDSDGVRWNEHNGDAPIFSGRTRARLHLLADGYFYLTGGLAIALLGAGLVRRRPWAILIGLVAAYWTAVHVVFFAEPRFHASLQPVIAVLAGAALVELFRTLRQKQLENRPERENEEEC